MALCYSDMAHNAEKWKEWALQRYEGVQVVLMPKEATNSGDGLEDLLSAIQSLEQKKKKLQIGIVGMPGTASQALLQKLK